MPRSEKPAYLLTAGIMLVIAAIPWVAGSMLQTATRNQVGDEVSTILNISHRAVQAWADGHRHTVESWADSAEVISFTQRLLASDPDPSALLSDPAQESAHAFFAPLLASRTYRGFSLIGRDGLTLSSTEDDDVGTPSLVVRQPGFLNSIWRGETKLGTPIRSDVLLRGEDGALRPRWSTMFVGAPIKGASGEIVAALTFRIDPTQDFTAILRRGRVGESGETYAFDAAGRLISESRFDDQLRSIGLIDPEQRAILNVTIRDPGVNLVNGDDGALPVTERPLTRMAANALAMQSGRDLDGYRDYRGVKVVGAWLWDQTLGLGITSEIDVAEAYGVLRSNRLAIAGATVFVELLILGVALVVVRNRRRLIESGERLQDLNAQLGIRIDELTSSEEALRASEARLEELVRSKDEFIASISHELRTPLTAVLGFAELLQGAGSGFSSAEQEEMIRSITEQAFDISNIVEDLLVAARAEIDSLFVTQVPVNLRAQLAQVIETWREAPADQVEIIGEPGNALGDPGRVRQILRNLLSNAARHGGDHIEVRMHDDESRVWVQVCDDGPGVPEEDRETIFEPYHRSHAVPGKPGSVGLGLTVSRTLARLMGGDLTYRYQDRSSIFEVWLPVANRPRGPESERARSAVAAGAPRRAR